MHAYIDDNICVTTTYSECMYMVQEAVHKSLYMQIRGAWGGMHEMQDHIYCTPITNLCRSLTEATIPAIAPGSSAGSMGPVGLVVLTVGSTMVVLEGSPGI